MLEWVGSRCPRHSSLSLIDLMVKEREMELAQRMQIAAATSQVKNKREAELVPRLKL